MNPEDTSEDHVIRFLKNKSHLGDVIKQTSPNELSRFLRAPFGVESLVNHFLMLYKKAKEHSGAQKHLVHQLHAILVLFMASDKKDLALKIRRTIPENMKSLVGNGLDEEELDTILSLSHRFIRLFLGFNVPNDQNIITILDDLEAIEKKRNMLDFLDSFLSSLTESCFDEFVTLMNKKSMHIEFVKRNVRSALLFVRWIAKFNGLEHTEEALEKLNFLNIENKMTVLADLNNCAGDDRCKVRTTRITEAIANTFSKDTEEPKRRTIRKSTNRPFHTNAVAMPPIMTPPIHIPPRIIRGT